MSMVWFVTGAGSGIGAGAVKVSLAAGDRVVAIARNTDKLTKSGLRLGRYCCTRHTEMPRANNRPTRAAQIMAAR